ncbi:hypothetical protein HYC85_001227 [Camellia sinensis]|uniref:CNNM transmembrane domain-containing protein n=1 Tax=Camellia sinensis TaxID=4442 RepID=A0A7J7I7A4_CAMSI|nr:hypothetical protein HYC85_001227 [Camellia sinensis]
MQISEPLERERELYRIPSLKLVEEVRGLVQSLHTRGTKLVGKGGRGSAERVEGGGRLPATLGGPQTTHPSWPTTKSGLQGRKSGLQGGKLVYTPVPPSRQRVLLWDSCLSALSILRSSPRPVSPKTGRMRRRFSPLLRINTYFYVPSSYAMPWQWRYVSFLALPIFLDALLPAWGAILISVSLILAFGEIIPQAVCSRYGLSVGAKLSVVVRLLVIVVFPIAYPISKVICF